MLEEVCSGFKDCEGIVDLVVVRVKCAQGADGGFGGWDLQVGYLIP